MNTKRQHYLIVLFTLLCFPGLTIAEQGKFKTEVYLDARYTISKGEPSWLDNWLGKARYGGELDGSTINKFALAEVSVLSTIDISWDWQAFIHLKNDPEQLDNVDLVEAFVKYQPIPNSNIKYAFKAGLFFPHISRENVAVAWTSPYTITPSAINSWVGEEIRVAGLKQKGPIGVS